MNKIDSFLATAVSVAAVGLAQPGCLAPDAVSCDNSSAIAKTGAVTEPSDAQTLCSDVTCENGDETVGVRCRDDGGKYSFTSCGQIEDLQGTAVADIKTVLDGGGTCMAGFDDCADGINVLTSTTPTDGTDAVNACKVAQGSCEIAIDRMGFHCSTIDGTSLEVTCRQVLDNVAAAFEGIVVTQCEGYVSN